MPDALNADAQNKMICFSALSALIEERGYSVSGVYVTADIENSGPVVGANLSGPRGNKGFLAIDADGLFSRDEATLWCDGVDYATRKVLKKQAEKRRRKV